MLLLAEGDDDDLPTPTIVAVAVAATSAVADAIAMADPIMEDRGVQLQGTAVAVIFFVNSRGMTNAALVAALGWGRPRIMVGRLLFAGHPDVR